MQKELIFQEFDDLKKTIMLLQASIEKFGPYQIQKIYTPEELEYYDALSFRFEKSVELILNFFKGIEIIAYAKTSDTLRDRLLFMQKLNIIDDIDFWFDARILRNKISHTYVSEELKDLYTEIYNRSKMIFDTLKRIEKYLEKIN